MADEPTKTPGSITQNADSKDQRISEISNVSRAISNMQKQIDQKISEIDQKVATGEDLSAIQANMNDVLRKLSATVGDMGKGFSSIAMNVAKGTGRTLAQMRRAMQDEVKYDPQKMVAMALSKTTGPIFGYYVSRFMETDVFKTAVEKMKTNIGNALSGVGSKLKGFVTGRSKGTKDSTRASIDVTKSTKEKIPHMQKGGVVEKGGVARLHAAEVVMPVDKLLKRMDDQISVTKALSTSSVKFQTSALAKMDTYIGEVHAQEKVGMFKGFLRALEEVQSQYEEPAEKRMLRSLLAIQQAIGAQIGTWEQVWQKMLIQHPIMRTSLYTAKIMRGLLGKAYSPVYGFFKGRGGYDRHLSKSSKPLQAMSDNIGTLYTGSMYRLDAIATFTRATAEAVRHISTALTGTRYKAIAGISSGKWSWFAKFRGALNALVAGTGSLGTRLIAKPFVGRGMRREIGESAADFRARKKQKSKEVDDSIKGFWGLTKKGILAREVLKKPGLVGLSKGFMEDIYGSEQVIRAKQSEEEYQKYMPKKMAKIAVAHGAMPVVIAGNIGEAAKAAAEEEHEEVSAAKMTKKQYQDAKKEHARKVKLEKHQARVAAAIQRKRDRRTKMAQKAAAKLVKKAQKRIALEKKALAKEKRAAKMEKIREGLKKKYSAAKQGLFGLFGGGGGIMGFIKRLGPMLLTIGGGLKGLITKTIGPAITGLFAAGGPIAAGMISTMATGVTNFLKNPAVLKTLGGLGAVAAAGYAGYELGKKLDEMLGITEKIQGWLAKKDQKDREYANEISSATHKSAMAAREGGRLGFEEKARVNLAARAWKGKDIAEMWNEDVGTFGRRNQAAIKAGQIEYMRKNIHDYLKYSPETLQKARRAFLRKNRSSWTNWIGMGGKGIGTSARNYGKKREADFLKFLKSNKSYKPLTDEQLQDRFADYQASVGLAADAPYVPYDQLSMTEKIQRNYGDKIEMAKRQTAMGIYQANEQRKAALEVGQQAIKDREKHAQTIKDATIVGANNVVNSVQNTTNNVMNQGQAAVDYMGKEYNRLIIPGEVDGD